MKFTAEQIAGMLNGKVEGDPSIEVNSLAKIEEGHTGALSFLSNPKYEEYIYNTHLPYQVHKVAGWPIHCQYSDSTACSGQILLILKSTFP